MADDDHFCGELVSNFLLNTCLCVHQRLNDDTIRTLALCVIVSGEHPPDDGEVALIPLITGSSAELYVQPILSCVGDFDIMYHRSDELAMLEGTAPPTHLPAEFHSRVKVFDILDSEFPGYVYLQSCYLLTECTDDDSYNAVRCPRQYERHARPAAHEQSHKQLHGPADVAGLTPPKEQLRIFGSCKTMDKVY